MAISQSEIITASDVSDLLGSGGGSSGGTTSPDPSYNAIKLQHEPIKDHKRIIHVNSTIEPWTPYDSPVVYDDAIYVHSLDDVEKVMVDNEKNVIYIDDTGVTGSLYVFNKYIELDGTRFNHYIEAFNSYLNFYDNVGFGDYATFYASTVHLLGFSANHPSTLNIREGSKLIVLNASTVRVKNVVRINIYNSIAILPLGVLSGASNLSIYAYDSIIYGSAAVLARTTLNNGAISIKMNL